jgi:hypothetical protein|nr:MAG TPA: hypothetical protein [Caudoviricetes sp.]
MIKEELIKQFDVKLQQLRNEFISNLEDDKKEFELSYPRDEHWVYYVDSDNGEILDVNYTANNTIDRFLFEHGYYFNTREEVEQHLKECKLLFKLYQWAKLKNDGWVPDWNNTDENKYFIKIYVKDKDFWINSSYTCTTFSKLPFFKSQKIAQECIDIFGDEIKEVLC